MKNILVTGGAGFIGSNFIKYMLVHYDYKVVNLDLLTYAGNLENLADIQQHPNYTFIKGDVRDQELVHDIFRKYDIHGVIHFAAESHVDKSIIEPDIFLTTNIIGTQVLLEAAKCYWSQNKYIPSNENFKGNVKFVQISTDEVYGTLGEQGKFVESMPLAPNNPYSASKASADLMVRAYYETYGLPINITRCSNNYGPYQFPEKLIPIMIYRCLQEKELPIYGDGMQIRDWLYVEDHCSAIDCVLHTGRLGEIYNIGGNNEKTNLEMVKYIIHGLGQSEQLITHVKDRLGHDRRYAMDNTKIITELGWKPAYTFEQGIQKTLKWYLEHLDWLERGITNRERDYYECMYKIKEKI